MVSQALCALLYIALCIGVAGLCSPRRQLQKSASLLLALSSAGEPQSTPHVVCIGAGFSGWGATRSLLAAGCKVTLLDAGNDPTGEVGTFTPSGKPFDAGTKGFWKDYPNVYFLLEDLKMDRSDVLTKCTNSSFYSPMGLEATAPIFGDSPILPSPLGQIAASAALFERLPIIDRVSVAGLLLAILDLTPETMRAYDLMTARNLFDKFGLSKRLVDDFLRPTLLVGLFKPPEELSAAVVMELLYFYAMAHQDAFDVCWIKSGSVASSFFLPLHKHLQSKYTDHYTVKSSSAVQEISVSDGRVTAVRFNTFDPLTKQITSNTVSPDGVVLAVGSKGLKAILSESPGLAEASPMLTRAATMGSIDCIAVRLWLDQKLVTRSPANVFANFPALRGSGGTFFMLDQLQPDEDALWAGQHEGNRGSVLACDFYNSGALMSLSDDDIVKLLVQTLLPAAIPSYSSVHPVVLDSYVKRYPGAVNHFSPNTLDIRPRIDVPSISNLKMAGDWVWMGDKEPKSKGLCQERAFVSGMEAASAMLLRLNSQGLNVPTSGLPVLPVRPDESQVVIGRAVLKAVLDAVFGIPVLKNLGGLLWASRE